ncbi:hypothetical protein ABES03_25280 [Neobacillus rhizosphaerae]|uniref:hypothetical protein n=1 Tax=Neobacillus rhizosphaerae TaxID=2880965 RepID=UPI003D2C751D
MSYISLFILSIVALSLGYWKYRNRLLFVHYFAVSGWILFFDYLIYAWGKAYKYYPNVIKGEFDTHMGALANAQILPAFAILYIAFQCKWYWGFVFAGFFTGIEYLFRHWEIFKNHWWRDWFTFVLLVPFFPFCKLWWKGLAWNPKKWLSFLSILSVFYVLYTQLNVLLYGVLKLRTIHVEWIERLNRHSTTIMNSPTGLLFGTIVTFLTISRARSFWYFLSILAFLAFDGCLKFAGIVRTDHIVLDSILSFCTFLIPLLIVKYISNKISGSNKHS